MVQMPSLMRFMQSAVHGSNVIFDEISAKCNTQLGRNFGMKAFGK
jgi:hypothetical protein